jgi:two-component system cell cycle response regulator
MKRTDEPTLRAIVVDDDRLVREMVSDSLAPRIQIEGCESAEAAIESLAVAPADLVITDLTMPGMTGLELLEQIRRSHPGTDCVLMTANASVESAVDALRLGAADYLTKPVRSGELNHVIDRILARRRLLAENERLRDALETVESCTTLMRCLDPGEVYAVALDLLLHGLGHSRGLVVFRRTAVPMNDGLAFRGFDEDESLSLRALLQGDKPFDIEALEGIDRAVSGPLVDAFAEAGVSSDGGALVVPVRGREAEAGVIWLFADGRPFEDADLERAAQIADHASLALFNAERYSRAKERAFIDDVTEVYNARYLLQATEHEIRRADRYEKPLCVLFLDLDRFKRVNDQFGHLVGSQALRQLSAVLLQCIRQVDTLARYGGDEFTILLTDTDLETGRSVAERIRRTVGETLFEGGRDAPIRLSISIGVACFPDHGYDRDSLLDVADKAMYRAKSLGRNRVCTASELSE